MSKFTDAVEAQAKREGLPGSVAIAPGFTSICEQCQDNHGFCCEHSANHAWENGKVCDEGSFSWYSCDLCGSHIGGDRFPAHFFEDDDHRKTLYHIEVCVDCLTYLANGDEPEEWEE
jgi:hypothetical protein